MREGLRNFLHQDFNNRYKIAIVSAILICLVALFCIFSPYAVDWHRVYRPVTLAALSGYSPYASDLFTNAPWLLIPLIPLALLPEALGRGILAVACLVSVGYVAWKFGARPLGIIAILLSPPVIQLVMDGNIDWMVLWGFILPPQIGLFFIFIKPQVGIGVVVYWLIEGFRKGGIKEVVRISSPLAITLIFSFLLYSFWPLEFNKVLDWGGNASLWPVSLPIGLVLLYRAIKKRQINYAVAASPCLTPYLLLHSYVGLFISFCQYTTETIIAVIGLWGVILIRALVG